MTDAYHPRGAAYIAGLVSLGGFLFGFDASVISGVVGFIVPEFSLNELQVGLVVGAALSIGLNIAMVEAFSLEPLAWYVIPAGMLALWAVGQAAVAGPARRASNIAPSIATRSG